MGQQWVIIIFADGTNTTDTSGQLNVAAQVHRDVTNEDGATNMAFHTTGYYLPMLL